MNSSEVLGIQAVRRALDQVRAGLADPLACDRLERIETVLARVAANLGRRPTFDPGLGKRPAGGAEAITWDHSAIRGWENEVAAFDPRRTAADRATDDLSGRLERYLRARLAGEAGLRVADARRLPGGRSKHTLIVEITGTDALPPKLVLRTDSSRTTEYDSVAREYPLIEAVFHAGCPVPEPYWLEQDEGIIGAAFIALAHMEGAPAGDLWGAYDKTGDAASALAGALAQLHRIPVSAVRDGRDQPARDAVDALFTSYQARWTAARPGPSSVIANAFAWLRERLATLAGPAVIVHGDAHFSNMLMAGGKLVGLLDWEFWHFGHPAEDLAYCRPYVEQTFAWNEFLGLYRKWGGPPVDDAALELFAVWRPLRNAVLAATVAHHFRSGEDLDLETAAIALATYPRMEAQVAAALAAAVK